MLHVIILSLYKITLLFKYEAIPKVYYSGLTERYIFFNLCLCYDIVNDSRFEQEKLRLFPRSGKKTTYPNLASIMMLFDAIT